MVVCQRLKELRLIHS